MEHSAQFSLVDVCLILTGVIWGLNGAAVKWSLREMSPLAFNALRFTLSSLLIMSVLYLRERSFRIDRSDIPKVIVTGFLGNTLYQILFINGINLSTAGNTALMLALMPVFIAILARVFGNEEIPAVGWLGIFASLTGVLLVAFAGGAGLTVSARTLRGDTLTFIGVLCWSVYTLMTKPLVKKYSPLRVTALTMVSGTVFLVIYALPEAMKQDWASVSGAAWGGLIFSFSLAIVFAYITWSWGVSKLGGARTAVYENIATVAGVFSSWLILKEPWSGVKFFGAALTLVGLFAVRSAELWRHRKSASELNAQ